METISVSKFKATCLSLLERVRKTGEPLIITKRGDPIAQVTLPPPPALEENSFGCMKDSTIIEGDILSPLPEEDWEVLSP